MFHVKHGIAAAGAFRDRDSCDSLVAQAAFPAHLGRKGFPRPALMG